MNRPPKALCLLGIGMIALAAGCGRAGWPPPEDLRLDGPGGQVIAGTLHRTPQAGVPGLLLIHGYGGNRSVWDGFAERVCREGYLVLTVDLPGHGESPVLPDRVSYRDYSTDDWLSMLPALAEGLAALVEAGAKPDDLGVIGETLGAHLALHLAAREPMIEASILLSPALERHGIALDTVMAGFAERPVLLLAGQRDSASATAATTLKEIAPGYSEIRFYDTSLQGTDFFASHPNSMDQILEWLSGIIGPRQAAPG